MTNAPFQAREQQVERVQGFVYGAFTAALVAAAGFLTFAQFATL